MIKEMINRATAEELFNAEAFYFNGNDAIPEYRIYELFGESAAEFFDRVRGIEGFFIGGKDWNGTGACTEERPFLTYFYKAGFMKIVSEHNYLLSLQAHSASDGGIIADKYKNLRNERLEAADAEIKRKAAERKAKRAAAKALKAQKQEE